MTDPSKAQALRGEQINRTETIPTGPLDEGLLVHTEAWTWNLVREPD